MEGRGGATVRTLTLAEVETRQRQLTSQLTFGDSCSKRSVRPYRSCCVLSIKCLH